MIAEPLMAGYLVVQLQPNLDIKAVTVWRKIQHSGLAILFIDHPKTLQLSNISPIISRKNLRYCVGFDTTQYRVSSLFRALIDWNSR